MSHNLRRFLVQQVLLTETIQITQYDRLSNSSRVKSDITELDYVLIYAICGEKVSRDNIGAQGVQSTLFRITEFILHTFIYSIIIFDLAWKCIQTFVANFMHNT